MPCDTIQTSTVDLQNVSAEMLSDALVAAGFKGDLQSGATGVINGCQVSVMFDAADHTLRVASPRNPGDVTAFVKRTYATHLLKTQATRYGWRVNTQADGRMVFQR